MSDYGIVLTTFGSSEQARPVIDAIINCKLAACVQEVNIKSHYIWKDDYYHDNEVLVLFKTRKSLYQELEKKLIELHPHETPEIIMVDISAGYANYLAWINEQVKSI
ncbi:MAG: divalent-cation tolerance protein CutA [Bacilli bacterium]|nr:divalent-cation tolerance protein CutA [Bacilli bacterium]